MDQAALKEKFRISFEKYCREEAVLVTKFLYQNTIRSDNFWFRDAMHSRPVDRAYNMCVAKLRPLITYSGDHEHLSKGAHVADFIKDYAILTYRLKKLSFVDEGATICSRKLHINDWDGYYVVESDAELDVIYGIYTADATPWL